MPSEPAIPPLLSHYLSLPPENSLILLTGTLGATVNWLVLRFIAAIVGNNASLEKNLTSSRRDTEGQSKAVLVSWMRDTAFWKDGGRKLNVDFNKVVLIDALEPSFGLQLQAVQKKISQVIVQAKHENATVLLILDGIDFLLAATACSPQLLLNLIGDLRDISHSVIVTACADYALLQTQDTPLETAHAAFVMSLAHQARNVIGVRELDTGGAMDVSGVLRITMGGSEWEDNEEERVTEERECLYFVGGDGSVKVFERGT